MFQIAALYRPPDTRGTDRRAFIHDWTHTGNVEAEFPAEADQLFRSRLIASHAEIIAQHELAHMQRLCENLTTEFLCAACGELPGKGKQ